MKQEIKYWPLNKKIEYLIDCGFKRCVNFEKYFVNANGDVINTSSHINANLLNTKYYDRYGYERVWLAGINHRPKYVLVHQLVLSAFVPNPDKKKYNQINHKDGNKLNNNLENLEWSNNSHNMLHKCRILGKTNVGEKASRSKLKERQVIEIFKSKKSIKEICMRYKISQSQVRRIKSKRNWGHLWQKL